MKNVKEDSNMSASKQKKLRSNSDAVDKKVIAAQEKAAKDKKFRHTVIICVIIFAVLIAAAVFINSDYLSTNTTAVVVNGNKYSQFLLQPRIQSVL